jgi:hypothetical protein
MTRFVPSKWMSPAHWLRRACPLLAAASAAAFCAGESLHAWDDPPATQAVHTSRPKFRIPFQFDPDEMARIGAVEIRLFVSTDQGKRWQHAQSVPPTEGRFTFEAANEGEYWFAVRTVDGQNQLYPPGPPQAGLQVVVDQTNPQLELRLREPSPGQVELSWRASDDHLDLSTLTLEYLDPAGTDWQAVNITPMESGQTTWSATQAGRLFVRGSVSDQAGNSSSADAATDVRAGNPAQPQPARPDFSQPVAGPTPDSSGDDVASLPFQPVIMPHGIDDASVPASLAPQTRPAPAPRPVSSQSNGHVEVPVAEDNVLTPAVPVPEASTAETANGIVTRYVRTPAFTVSYELEDVGPSGVASVDLYITENNGFKWFYYGPDEDKRSPLEIEVPEDGSYGFAIRVRSGVGLVQDPPQPGEGPTLVVVVDRQPPQAEITAAVQGQGASRGEVEIQWTVKDERLPKEPVLLSQAASPSGPWQPITGWIENTGRYRWKVDNSRAQPVYLRLEARDSAGNLTRVDTKSPLVLDLSRPSARITDVEADDPQ